MKIKFSPLFLKLTASVIIFFGLCVVLSSCAYKLSSSSDELPGKVKSLQIPLFINDSMETGVEAYFTNALKTEALRASFVELKNSVEDAEAILQGRIVSVSVTAAESIIEAKNTTYMPIETVLGTNYQVQVLVELTLKRTKTGELLWKNDFAQGSNFSSAQITLPVINTANSLYNQSSKRQTLETLSKEMMQAAFDRMMENF